MAGNSENIQMEKINPWIFDYAYWYSWEEFSKTRKVDVNSTRDFVQWNLTQFDLTTADHTGVLKKLILGILCMLSDGSYYNIRYNQDTDLTVLEVMLQTYQNICDHVPATLRQAFMDFIPSIKLQAVLVCLRQGDTQTAWQVFQRQWESSTVDETMKKEVRHMLKSKNTDHPMLTSNAYDAFLDDIFALLEKLNEKFSPPFLNVLSKCMGKAKVSKEKESKTEQKRSYPASSINKAARHQGVNNISTLNADESKTLKDKLLFIREKKIADSIARSMYRVGESFYGNDELSDRNENAEIGEEEEIDVSLRKRLPVNVGSILRPSTRHTISPVKTWKTQLFKLGKWSSKETEDFYQAVQRLGVGNWAVIKSDLKSPRSNVQLKDKWRTIATTQDIKLLEKKFGPI